MRVQDDKVPFIVFKAMRCYDVGEECSSMDDTESSFPTDDPLEQLLAVEMLSDDEKDENHTKLEVELKGITLEPHFESLELEFHEYKQLKAFQLKNCLIELTENQEEKLINFLKKFTKVSPIQCVLRNGNITVVKNENNELIPTKTVTSWRICIDYLKWNNVTQKDNFLLSFLDQRLDRLAGHDYYCFLDEYSRYNQILEKCHFMVRESIILGHRITRKGIEVDKEKIDVIKKLPPLVSIKGIRSFLGHRRFIKDFSKIAKPLCKLLEKASVFNFDRDCLTAFEELKKRLVSAPIIITPDWSSQFELMPNTSNYAVGVVLGQRRNKIFHSIHYASQTLTRAQLNYTVTKKKKSYLLFLLLTNFVHIFTKVTVYIDHTAIKNLMLKRCKTMIN
ncbi:Retrovirus-related Pol polyprotein from transposon 17.6 [Gossypium australe]|uniref:Retrovirus-related Pol polyprotein from transposon 17.6 n=1 Tax=Gossypium australe TaxID=47621 RepID=A0A5B6W6E1_9ROSI|nr:Retrovirus-related Pol polyprotein from transposon 17.6 [Gossypium australe]